MLVTHVADACCNLCALFVFVVCLPVRTSFSWICKWYVADSVVYYNAALVLYVRSAGLLVDL